MHYRF